MTVMNAYRNEFIDSLPTEKRKSAMLSGTFIGALWLILILIKYTTPDPPPLGNLMVEDEMLDTLSVKDLIIANGGSAKGGGTPKNSRSSDPKEQTEQLLTNQGNEPLPNGNSNHTNGNNSNNPSSSPNKGNNPFGDGGNGGGTGGGKGPFDGSGKGTGGEGDVEGDGIGSRNNRKLKNSAVIPNYPLPKGVDKITIHLKVTVSGDGNVTNAEYIRDKSNITDQTIISDVIKRVILQAKYNKDPEGKIHYCDYTVIVNAK